MMHEFDPGYGAEPYKSLCANYPGMDVYPPDQFRVEWGPIFHRGRLDGSAHILVIGQDPAQHESIARRVLVGEAGRRLQGFLAKLGINRSYVIINTYLYSVYGSVKASTQKSQALISYRNQWLDALLSHNPIECVVALGQAADKAWKSWLETSPQSMNAMPYAPITHPTQPESSSKGEKQKLLQATAAMLKNWNNALTVLTPSMQHPDINVPLVPYSSTWSDGNRPSIPEADMPAGLPSWMHQVDGWARRVGTTDLAKRRNITLTVPTGVVS